MTKPEINPNDETPAGAVWSFDTRHCFGFRISVFVIIGSAAAALSLLGAFTNRPQFFHSYLFAWLFWSGLSLGALVLLMMHSLTGGKWGDALRSLTSAAVAVFPFMALLFLPLLFGLHENYAWAHGLFGEAEHAHKAQYLTAPLFIIRSIFYFLLFIGIGHFLRHWSQSPPRMVALSSGGLVAYLLCLNFASTDWVMSLTPAWHSTIFVIILAAGQFLGALALMTSLLVWISRNHSLGRALPPKVFHDLGSLLLAFVIFWTYVSFSQFLIIWSGNLPKEIGWYLIRSRGGWQWFGLALVLAQFLLPFLLLLSRAAKQSPGRLGGIALAVVMANVLATFWLIAPVFHPERFYLHWLDLTEWLALGGFWFALFFHFLKQRPLVPAELWQNG